ncbi:hypothetical protein GGX14DRAFT_579476 [Mycena pura]|uniref:Uncharacterized protein n=1 Tax=Mycena pura TaxID=153505 RepID=A0AAD6UMZ7_9AGAR|nr:hypothetical protein GGX14DRAFT_579476 [Mycena pura]
MSPTSASGTNTGIGGRASGFISTGATATPQAVVDLLKKLDQQRQDRNAKRTRRKADGEANVSEDEEDEITPVLVVPAGGNTGSTSTAAGNAGPSSAGNGASGGTQAPAAAAGHGKRALIATDAEAAKNSLDNSDGAIPKAIRVLAQSGISPPLTLFSPDALQRIRSGLGTKSVKVTTELKDSVHLLDISLFPDESTLDLATWFPYYNTFLKFIDDAYDVGIFDGFAKHFEFMIGEPDFNDWFTAFRDFDIRLRSHVLLPESHSPRNEDRSTRLCVPSSSLAPRPMCRTGYTAQQ